MSMTSDGMLQALEICAGNVFEYWDVSLQHCVNYPYAPFSWWLPQESSPVKMHDSNDHFACLTSEHWMLRK